MGKQTQALVVHKTNTVFWWREEEDIWPCGEVGLRAVCFCADAFYVGCPTEVSRDREAEIFM